MYTFLKSQSYHLSLRMSNFCGNRVGVRAKVDFFVRAKVDGFEQSPCGCGTGIAPKSAKKSSVRAKVDRLVCAQKWTTLLPVLRQLARPLRSVLKRIPVDDVEAVRVDD